MRTRKRAHLEHVLLLYRESTINTGELVMGDDTQPTPLTYISLIVYDVFKMVMRVSFPLRKIIVAAAPRFASFIFIV